MSRSVKVKIDVPSIMRKFQKLDKASRYKLCSTIRADTNEFVKLDQGQLKQSSYWASQLDKGLIIWRTPYAKKQYYTGKPRTVFNPNASLMWCEKSKKQNMRSWNSVANKLYKKRRLT